MARTIRQREDDRSKWDVLEEGPDGTPRVSTVDTVTAARMQKGGDVITSGEEWGNAYKAAEERAGVMKRGGAGAPGMVHALDENDEPVVASLDTVRKRGWEVVTPETAASAGEAVARRRSEDQTGRVILPDNPATQVAEMRSSMGLAAPARSFRRMSPEDARAAERDVRGFQASLAPPARQPAPARAVRPEVSVQRAGAAEPMRPFQSLAQFAPGMNADGAGDAAQAAAPTTPAGDEEFAAAQEEARARRAAAGIGRAGAMLNQAISGAGFDPSIYEGFESNADLPVKELLARREANKRKSLEDPFSDASKRLQMAVSKALPGVYSPEEIAGMTAADADVVTKYGEMRQRLDQRMAELARSDRIRTEDMGREDARIAEDRAFRAEQADLARQDRRDARASAAADRALRQEELAAMTADKVAQKQAERAEQQTRQFSETVGQSGAPNFYSQYASAKEIMDRNPSDLPGYGGVAGRLPDVLTSKEGVDLRQALGQMLAEYRKGVTGAGMSDAERSEYGQITGLLQSGDESSVRQGAARLRQAMDARLQAAAGGYRSDVVEEYGRRVPAVGAALGRGSGASPVEARTVVDRIRMPDGKTVVLYSDGSEEVTQ